MKPRRVPRTYRTFLAVALLQFGLLILISHTRVVDAGIALFALLLWRLSRGGLIAWMLLLVANLLESLAALALIGNGTGVLWANVAIIVIPGLIMVSLLLSAPMRQHVGLARSHPAH